jgi:hypothetical protein
MMRGRPKQYNSKRHNLTMRVTEKMHDEIKRRSQEAGRSMSEEIELILEKVIFPICIARDWET